MQIERCGVCGWPVPKGRPCPRGCGTLMAAGAPTQTVGAAAAVAPPVPPPTAPPARAPEAARTPPAIHCESRVAKRLAGPSGLGGYLLLPIIGLFITIFWNARYLIQTLIPLYRSTAWAALATPGAPEYHWLWRPLILFETFGAVAMAITPVALLIMIFRRRRAARRYTIAFYVFSCVVGAADAIACLLVMVGWLRSLGLTETANAISSDALRTLAGVVALAAIWIPYFIRSRRVRNTLSNPPLPGQADPAYFVAAGEKGRASRRRVDGRRPYHRGHHRSGRGRSLHAQ